MKRFRRFWEWLHHESHPFWNLLITSGFHVLLTIVTEQNGLHGHATFMYLCKEGGPLIHYGIDGKDRWVPSEAEAKRGWTRTWKIADSVADFMGPFVVFLRYHFVA